MNLTTNLIKAVYYKHKEYIKGLESTEVPLPLEMQTKIEAINDKFDRLYSIRRNKNAAIIEGLKNLLFEIKNNLKDAKIDQFDIGRRIEEPGQMVFISHNSLDKPLAKKISSELERFGIITWLDEKDIDYVKRNIIYTNQHSNKKDGYCGYLARALEQDWGVDMVKRTKNAADNVKTDIPIKYKNQHLTIDGQTGCIFFPNACMPAGVVTKLLKTGEITRDGLAGR